MLEEKENNEFEIDNKDYEVVDASEVKETSVVEAKKADPRDRISLYAFILTCAANMTLGGGWFLSIGTIIMSSIAIKLNRQADGVTNQPYKVFHKIVKYAAVAFLVLGIILTVVYSIRDILKAINEINANQ